MNPTSIVAYYRVSTKRQNLGLEAQRRTVESYAARVGASIVESFTEKESGKECDRPGLNLALATARKHRALLVVAKADRLSRDIAYAAHIVFHGGVDVLALDIPEEAMGDALMFGVHFGLAQKEAAMISARTKAALAAKKEQGFKLGAPAPVVTASMRAAAAAARTEKANANQRNQAAAQELRRFFAGAARRNMSEAARHLNELQLYTSRGFFHTANSVKLLISRFGI